MFCTLLLTTICSNCSGLIGEKPQNKEKEEKKEDKKPKPKKKLKAKRRLRSAVWEKVRINGILPIRNRGVVAQVWVWHLLDRETLQLIAR